jgi:hypothetical protein
MVSHAGFLSIDAAKSDPLRDEKVSGMGDGCRLADLFSRVLHRGVDHNVDHVGPLHENSPS